MQKRYFFCIVFIIVLCMQPVYSMYEIILQQFQSDVSGSTPHININTLSPDLLRMYQSFFAKIPVQQRKGFSDLENQIESSLTYFLVPTDDLEYLKRVGLCPLFDYSIKPIAMYYEAQVGKNPQYAYYNVEHTPSCVVQLGVAQLGSVVGKARELIQLKTLSQGAFESHFNKTLDSGFCAGHSLNNILLLDKYIKTGDEKFLKDMHDFDKAYNFLKMYVKKPWLTVSAVKESIELYRAQHIDVPEITVVSSALLFSTALKSNKDVFKYCDKVEYDDVQNVRIKIIEGLKKADYAHFILLGNEETVSEHATGHYFAFAIIKSNNKIQYIVMDTSTTVYHLQEGSSGRNRLQLIIDNIEKQYSQIHLPYLRAELAKMPGAFGQGNLSQDTIEKLTEELKNNSVNAGYIQKKPNDLIKQIVNTNGGILQDLSLTRLDEYISYICTADLIFEVESKANYPQLKKLLEDEKTRRLEK